MSIAKKKSMNPRQLGRLKRQVRVRKRVKGSNECPRLCVFKALRYTYAQLISDAEGLVIASVSSKTLSPEGDTESASRKSSSFAKLVGKKIGEIAKEKKITSVVFDRNGYIYHGRVKAVAEGAREAGLKF